MPDHGRLNSSLIHALQGPCCPVTPFSCPPPSSMSSSIPSSMPSSIGHSTTRYRDAIAHAMSPVHLNMFMPGPNSSSGLTMLAAVHTIVDQRCWLPFILCSEWGAGARMPKGVGAPEGIRGHAGMAARCRGVHRGCEGAGALFYFFCAKPRPRTGTLTNEIHAIAM